MIMAGSTLRTLALTKEYGDAKVLDDIALEVRGGEFLTLVGPSGCGKSTLLKLIAGLEPQTSGQIMINDNVIDHLRPKQRHVAMVFQSYALYPHMSVRDNLSMPLEMQRLSFWERLPMLGSLKPSVRKRRRAIRNEIDEIAGQLQITPLLDRKPGQLSGGQRQRVALGRAMVRRPQIFLMDEPLSNLDASLRVLVRTELAELHKRLGATFIYVTHDQVEAMTMSHRIAVMMDGEIVQIGTPSEVYGQPNDLRVARFIGSPAINLFPAHVRSDGAVVAVDRTLPLSVSTSGPQDIQLGIRPEDIKLHPFKIDVVKQNLSSGHVRRVENLGSEYLVYFDMDTDSATQIVARLNEQTIADLFAEGAEGVRVGFEFDLNKLHLFGSDGKRLTTTPKDELVVHAEGVGQ